MRRSPARSAAWCGWAAPSAACRGVSSRRNSGASERYLAQIESGAGNPSVVVMRAIADALEMPIVRTAAADRRRSRRAMRASSTCLAALPPDELPAIADLIERHDRPRRRGRPRAAHRAGRSARRGQIDARPDAGRQARLCRSSSSTAWSSRNTARACRMLIEMSGVATFRRHERACLERVVAENRAGGDRDRGRHRLQSRNLRAAAAPHPHGLDQRAARGAHEPGDEAGRFPADGEEPRGDGRPASPFSKRAAGLRSRRSARSIRRARRCEQSLAKLDKIVRPG